MIEKCNLRLSSVNLKLIAVITMLLDHCAVVFFTPSSTEYFILRSIGRLAFPIYCFLLAQGFRHTRNVKRYIFRLFCFAIISEIPFDLIFYGKAFYLQHQNVFFTLLIALSVMAIASRLENKSSMFPMMAVMLAGMILAELIRCDYGCLGVLVCIACWLAPKYGNSQWVLIIGSLILLSQLKIPQIFGVLAVGLLFLYDDNRPTLKNPLLRSVFYWFYPAHLLILYAIHLLIQ